MMKKFEKYNELEIIERVRKGEKALYEIIVRRFNPYLYKVGRSYNYSHEDTQDLMQDTFVDAFKALSQFNEKSSFKTWIVRIMLNNCYRKNKKSSFTNEIMQEINDNDRPLFNNSENDVNKTILNRELGHIIETTLATIPESYRLVFSLREINGMNVVETADLLNISESNVKVRLNRAKEMLRSKLEANYTYTELFDFNLMYCDTVVDNVMIRIKNL